MAGDTSLMKMDSWATDGPPEVVGPSEVRSKQKKSYNNAMMNLTQRIARCTYEVNLL